MTPRASLEDLVVSNLKIPGTSEWDVEFISDIFIPSDVDHILSMSAGDLEHDDRLAWKFDRKGLYSVKSGYRVTAVENLINIQVPYSLSWTVMWSFRVPPKVKLFLWKLCCCYLPMGEQLFLKGCTVSNVCVFCGDISEHPFHLFVDCVFAMES